jgi:hypothetical protein
MHLLVEKNPAASAMGGGTEEGEKKEKKEPPLTLAFVDSDSVSLLPMTNILQHPFVSA